MQLFVQRFVQAKNKEKCMESLQVICEGFTG